MSAELPATRMSLLKALESDARAQNLIALGVFYERYRRGLAKFLISRYGLDVQEANDILHDFLYEKMVDANLIHSYLDCLRQSPSGHRAFRPYLVRSLCNFTIDRMRRQRDAVFLPTPEPAALDTDYTDLYVLEWSQDILAATFQRTRHHYVHRGKEKDWTLFVQRWIEPLVLRKSPPTYEQLATEHGFDHAKQVGNVLTNVLRTFKQKWTDVLTEDIGTDDRQAIAEAQRDARLSVRMAKHIDFSRLLTQAMQSDGDLNTQTDANSYSMDETGYKVIIELATDGFDQLLPIEKALLFESHLHSTLGAFLSSHSSFCKDASVTDMQLKDLLRQSSPDPTLLEHIGKQLKACIRGECAPLPASIAGVLRFALIAIAETRCNRSISSVPKNELASAMMDIAELPWIDDTCRGVIQAYLQRHEPSSAALP